MKYTQITDMLRRSSELVAVEDEITPTISSRGDDAKMSLIDTEGQQLCMCCRSIKIWSLRCIKRPVIGAVGCSGL